MQKRGAAARLAILDAALALFLEVGYKTTSMDAISSKAGVSKATVYAHFTGKEDLFRAVVSRFADQILRLLPQVRLVDDVRGELVRFANSFYQTMLTAEKTAWDRMIVAAVNQFPHLAKDYFDSGPLRAMHQIRDFLHLHHQAGVLRVPDPDFSAEMLIGMLTGIKLYHGLLFGEPVKRDELKAEETIDAFLKVHAP